MQICSSASSLCMLITVAFSFVSFRRDGMLNRLMWSCIIHVKISS